MLSTELCITNASKVEIHIHLSGNVHERHELDLNAEHLPEAAARLPATLSDCIVDGTLIMDDAVKLIFEQNQRGTDNHASYKIDCFVDATI